MQGQLHETLICLSGPIDLQDLKRDPMNQSMVINQILLMHYYLLSLLYWSSLSVQALKEVPQWEVDPQKCHTNLDSHWLSPNFD